MRKEIYGSPMNIYDEKDILDGFCNPISKGESE
jgi:hypothetical protein